MAGAPIQVLGFRRRGGGLPSWTVKGSTGEAYEVMFPRWPSDEDAVCTCPDYWFRGEERAWRCKHILMVLAAKLEEPLPPPDKAFLARMRLAAEAFAALEAKAGAASP